MGLLNTYSSLDITFDKGKGAYLYSGDKKYLDFLSGIAVCGVGHAHPQIADAIAEQARTLIHTTNIYKITNQESLADKLCELSNMDKVFFGNSGAEANEAAIKIARKFGNSQKIENPEIIVTNNSFHGRTMATLSATGNNKIQAGFEPLVTGFIHVDYDDISAIKDLAATNSNIVAILVEPIQGEGGVNIPSPDYLQQIRQICTDNNWLMMLDEIQTGMARTGKMFCFQHNNITPDVMTLAKGLANGVPIGACLTSGIANQILEPGNHGSTFGGNPLSTRAALETISIIESNNLDTRAHQLGEIITQILKKELKEVTGIIAIRNMGLMIGIELNHDCTSLVKEALNQQLLINVTHNKVIRLLPPLILTDEQAQTGAMQVAQLILDFYKN